MTNKSLFLAKCTLLLASLFNITCTSKKVDIESNVSIPMGSIKDILMSNSGYKILIGNLFSPNEEHAYIFDSGKGKHLIFKLDKDANAFLKIFEFEGGIGSKQADITDCNFDSINDLVISIDAGGNYDDEIKIIFLMRGNSFFEVNQQVSFPIFDQKNSIVLSRYQGPNDSTVTIEEFVWESEYLKLVDKREINQP